MSNAVVFSWQDTLGLDHIPLAATGGGLKSAGSTRSASNSSCGTKSWAEKRRLYSARVYPQDISSLPKHIAVECQRLNDVHKDGGLLTEPVCRPLVNSVCIWLLRKGVTNKTDHPEVFAKVSRLLHAELPLDKLASSGRGSIRGKGKVATNFETRIDNWMVNHVRGSDSTFKLELAHDTVLNSPLHALVKAKVAIQLEEGVEPKQGHRCTHNHHASPAAHPVPHACSDHPLDECQL